MKPNKTIIEKGLILFSSMGLLTFLFPATTYLEQLYLLTSILLYTAYFLTSRVSLQVSWTVAILLVLCIILLLSTVLHDEFAFKRSYYYTYITILWFLQFNNQIFVKHRNLAWTSLLMFVWGFNFIFAVKLSLSDYDVLYNIERHFDNIGLYAIFLSLSVILLSSYHKTLHVKYPKAMIIGVFIIVTYCVIILGSRTAFLIIFSYVLLQGMKGLRMSPARYCLGGCLVGIIILLSFSLKIDSSHGRILVWKITGDIVKHNPLTGIGYRNFPAVYPINQASVYLENKMTESEILLADNVKVAFNEFLQITAESGIIGLSLMLFIIALCFYYTSHKSIILCICIAMTFSYILHSPIIVFLITLILSPIDIPLKIKFSRSFSVILLIAAVVFTVHTSCFIIQKYRCSSIAEKLYNQAPLMMMDYYEKNKKYLCDNIKTLFLMAEVYYQHNMPEKALILLGQLDKSIRRNDIELLRARCYAKIGNYTKEEEHLKLSVAMCPNRFVSRYELFRFYVNHQMINKAVMEAKKIFHLKEKIITPQSAAIKLEVTEYLEKYYTNNYYY